MNDVFVRDSQPKRLARWLWRESGTIIAAAMLAVAGLMLILVLAVVFL